MHVERFLHNLLKETIHKSRIKLLSCVVSSVIDTKELKLTSLGRAFNLPIQERSGIRKMDRVLGNEYFQKRNHEIYEAIIRLVVGNKGRPVIIVDWTKLPNVNEYALRAAIAMESRAITLYEEVHPKKKEGNKEVHEKFLKRLKRLLPASCSPIIVTDAGFKNPWFRSVLKQGWDYVGRVRGGTKYGDKGAYKFCNDLHKKATFEPQYLGEKALSKRGSLVTHFYMIKKKLKGRKKYTKSGKISTDKDSRNYSKSYREPWLLVSSLSGHNAAKKVIKIYEKRMVIEEGFRDLKSHTYGFSMENNKTLKRERLGVWLLIAALASLLAWITGYKAEQMNLHYQFQSNSIRDRRILSFFYLGCQIIRKKIPISIDLKCLKSLSLAEKIYV